MRDAKVAIQVSKRSRLAKMLDTQCYCSMARDAAQPGEGGGVAVKHGDQQAVPWHITQQALDVASRLGIASLAGP